MVISDFIKAVMEKDHEALAACFDKRGRLIDYCPSLANRQDTFLYGQNSITMYFHNRFKFNGFTMHDPRITSDHTADFFADYGGTLVHAVAEIELYSGDSSSSLDERLIKEIVIRPA